MKTVNKKNNIFVSKNENELFIFLKRNLNQNDLIIFDKVLVKNNLIKKLSNLNNIKLIKIEGNEKIKSLKDYSRIAEKILELGINRKSKIVSIGGGTIGDLIGFISSTLLRGIEHIMIPTTLLSMVDSSIGGKTGINSKVGKNLIGTFYMPKIVIINLNFLKTLPSREMSCGFAEVIKYAFIHNNKLKTNLKNYDNDKLNLKKLENIIIESIKTKLNFTKDFRELKIGNNSRAILNFGHSFGHAIESLNYYKSSIKHGEAVALGMIIEINISNKLNLKPNSIENLKKLLIKFHLPTNYKKFINLKNINNIFEKIKKDKKAIKNDIQIILIKGNKGINRKISFDSLKKIIINLIK